MFHLQILYSLRLSHQIGADTLILNDSNCLYRQRRLEKIYLAHTGGMPAPSNSEILYYNSPFIYSFVYLLVEGSLDHHCFENEGHSSGHGKVSALMDFAFSWEKQIMN